MVHLRLDLTLTKKFSIMALSAGLLCATAGDVEAEEAVLHVSKKGGDAPFTLTTQALAAMPQVAMDEKTEVTATVSRFEEPLLSDVLAGVEISGPSVHLIALDDYTVDVPLEAVEKYQPIIAIKRDGTPMEIDDLGPFYVIWPFSKYPEINNDLGWSWAIWQLSEIRID